MDRLRQETRTELGGEPIRAFHDRRDGNVLLYDLEDGGRVAVRPSGTEPKIKLYLEVVEPYDDPRRARRARAAIRLLASKRIYSRLPVSREPLGITLSFRYDGFSRGPIEALRGGRKSSSCAL